MAPSVVNKVFQLIAVKDNTLQNVPEQLLSCICVNIHHIARFALNEPLDWSHLCFSKNDKEANESVRQPLSLSHI